MKRLQAVFKGMIWNSPPVIIATVVSCLMVGSGIYYMATVDAVNSSLDGSWIWFLGATIAFISLELYFGHGDEQGQAKAGISPDAPEQHEL